MEIARREVWNLWVCEFPLGVQLLRWKIIRWNAPRIWRDFGSALPFQTRLTQTMPVLPLSNEHGSQVKNQGRRQCCHNKHIKFPYTWCIFTFRTCPLYTVWHVLHILETLEHTILSTRLLTPKYVNTSYCIYWGFSVLFPQLYDRC